MNENIIDFAFMPVFKHINALMNIEEASFSDDLKGFRLYMDEIIVEMPVEIDLGVDENGVVHIGSTPPIYYANTSILPVFHNLKVTIKEEKEE
jgi:hypothetical protein